MMLAKPPSSSSLADKALFLWQALGVSEGELEQFLHLVTAPKSQASCSSAGGRSTAMAGLLLILRVRNALLALAADLPEPETKSHPMMVIDDHTGATHAGAERGIPHTWAACEVNIGRSRGQADPPLPETTLHQRDPVWRE